MPLIKMLRKLPVQENEKEIATFINRELIPFLQELRDALSSTINPSPAIQSALAVFGRDGEDGYSPQPIPGPTGPAGQNGQTIPARDGSDGASAYSIPGERGIQGMPGIGVPGRDGNDGHSFVIPGINGINGRDGFSIPGRDGEDGESTYSIPGPKGDKGDKGEKGDPGRDGEDGEPGPMGPPGANGSAGSGSSGWDDVLAIDNNSGANNPHIDTSQFLSFGNEGTIPAAGQIRSSATMQINVTGQLDIDASTNIDITTGATNLFQVAAQDLSLLSVGGGVTLGGAGSTGIAIDAGSGALAVTAGTDIVMSSIDDTQFNADVIQLVPTGHVEIVGEGFLIMQEEAASTPSLAAARGMYWVLNETNANVPMFTDDVNADWRLGFAASQSITANDTATNATTNLSFGSFTHPANTLKANSVWKFEGYFVYVHTAAATPTLTLELLINAVVVDSVVMTPQGTALTFGGYASALMTVRTSGATGTIMVNTKIDSNSVTTAGNDGSTSTATDTINTTVTRSMEMRIRMTTAVASNTLTVTQGWLQRIR